MTAPQLDHLMTLEAPVQTSDGAGGQISGWVPLGTIWAALQPRSGRISGDAVGGISRASYHVVTRAAPMGDDARPQPGQRLTISGRVFSIRTVTEYDAAGRYLVCSTTEETRP